MKSFLALVGERGELGVAEDGGLHLGDGELQCGVGGAVEWLEQSGAQVKSAESAFEAINLLKKTPVDLPDVIVSDLAMPDEDGYSLLARIRKLSIEKGGKIPALALSAFATNENKAAQACTKTAQLTGTTNTADSAAAAAPKHRRTEVTNSATRHAHAKQSEREGAHRARDRAHAQAKPEHSNRRAATHSGAK